MSTTYTNDENIRFLNDKNISQTLGDDTARQTNTVPSLDLLNEVNNALTAYDDRLCAYIGGLNKEYKFDETSPYLSVITKIQQVKGKLTEIETVELLSSHVKNLKEFVENTIDSLDVATLAETNKFVRTLTEIDGKIQATFTKVLSSDFEGQLQQTQIENLTTDLDSCYKKAGGLINGDAQVNGRLSVANDLIVNNDSTVRGNFIQGRGTSYIGDAQHSVVMGISASTSKDDVFLWNGKQDEAYTDHGRGTFNINAVNDASGVFVGSKSLEQIVDKKREDACNFAKKYTDDVSAALSDDYVKKIETAKIQAYTKALNDANGYTNGVSTSLSDDYVSKIKTAKTQAYDEALNDANGYTDDISTTLSGDYVSKIAIAKSEATAAAATDATEKVNALNDNLLSVGMLVSTDLAFNYNERDRQITLNIKDYGGINHTFTIDSARFIKGRIVDHVNIIEIDGQQVLRIWWTVEEGGTGVYSDVPLATLAQVYTAGTGINIELSENGGYEIAVDSTIVNNTVLNGKIAEINSAIGVVNGKTDTNTAKITSLSEISASHDGRIQTLESGLATANISINKNADDLTTANERIDGLEAYAHSLSSPDGKILALSNAIKANFDYAHNTLCSRIELDEGKIEAISAHAGRLQTYANSLSDANGQIQTLSNAITANTANVALANGNINSLQAYANQLSDANGQIQTLSNAITAVSSYAHDRLSGRIERDEEKIDIISARAESLQEYANLLSNDGGTINTLSNDIIQLSTNIIDSNTFIGEIKINYNNLTTGTDQAWISHCGNTLSGIIKHFNLAPLGYVKQNTIIKVTYTNVPSDADRTKLATLKYVTDDGIAFTDNDYIIIHGNFDQIKLENIAPNNVYYANAVKRCELFELSNTVYNNYALLSGNSNSNGHAISGLVDFINDISVGESLSVDGHVVVSTDFQLIDSFHADKNGVHLENKQIDGVLSGESPLNAATYGQVSVVNDKVDKKIWIDDKISNTIPEHFSDLSIVKLTKADYDTLVISSQMSGNVLYIVDSNYIDAYGQEIRNVLSSTEPTNAATYGQLSLLSTALSSKQDVLADAQISAIDSVVSARATEMVFDDGAVSAFNWVGEIDWHTMVDAGLRIASYVNWRRKPVVVRIGNAVTSLGYSPFYGCTKLESITIPESVTSIGEDAFNSCTKLENITIPKSAANIGKNTFYTCTKLSSIIIQESVTSISEGAFGYCTNLSNILIPESINSIGKNAFTNCTNLTSLVFKGKTLAEVQAMPNYPWGIIDTSIISIWNDASQEMVDSKLSGYVQTSAFTQLQTQVTTLEGMVGQANTALEDIA